MNIVVYIDYKWNLTLVSVGEELKLYDVPRKYLLRLNTQKICGDICAFISN
jgi:hypothetical protein